MSFNSIGKRGDRLDVTAIDPTSNGGSISDKSSLTYDLSRSLAKTPVAENIAEAYFKVAEAKNVKAQTLQNQIAQNEVHVRKRQNKNSAPLKSVGRIALIELAPTFFGIFIAMFAVLNEQIVVGTAVLSSLLVAKLIGIGLATGSLKQLIDK